ncbi:MAG: Flp family type IVb pilin [Thermomicrobiales bacterium]
MFDTLHRLITEDQGQDLIEYALIAGFLSLVCYLTIQSTGKSISDLWSVFLSKATDAAARI